MAQIQDIPVEILRLIFKNIYLTSRALRYPERYESDTDSDLEENDDDKFQRRLNRSFKRGLRTFPPEIIWTDESMHSPAKFPFNVANTCKLWRDVVLSLPENWVDIRFDLAHDPASLLDAFAASRNILFSVLVFTTANDRTERGQTLEKERTHSIVQHLLPHMKRCTSVVFNLIFASSLPSPVPFLVCNPPELTELTLDYQVYNLPSYYKGTNIHPKPTPSPPTKLTKMSMNGSAFMDIIHLGNKWLRALKTGMEQAKNQGMKLYLRDFQLPISDDDIIFVHFIHLLHFFDPSYELHLEKISMAYHPHIGAGSVAQYDLSETSWSLLTFKNVSKDFIAEFFQSSAIGMVEEQIHFISCSIPRISGGISVFNLTLTDVPASTPSFSEDDDSLYNLVPSWNGGSLSLISCPTFNDKFVHWLAGEGEDGLCEARGIGFLEIQDCQSVSTAAIRRLVAAVNDPVMLKKLRLSHNPGIKHLTVSGQGPLLNEEDLSWFKRYNGRTTIIWEVQTKDSFKTRLLEFKGKWGNFNDG
ncbi:hypothetical protein HYPSUDRAFT_69166 [Hypholoma sublateritium FD-334 SS-4]|uniref:F-box domain-containing protein n=1 Tax=Hypholoma sublateritium (strain FD-334 SS-4) TaxID=945553 RepID=A0A0D2KYN7_HYPSF|nr:hypothetical protein HYPSUDRAFT_69166 [Hypholoma sublateritium FD-334 SS-4]